MSFISLGCAPAQQPPSPNFDALAASFGALSVAVAIGSILVGILAIVITVVWNKNVKSEAMEAARESAREVVTNYLSTAEAKTLIMEGAANHFASNSMGLGAPLPIDEGKPLTNLNGSTVKSWKRFIPKWAVTYIGGPPTP